MYEAKKEIATGSQQWNVNNEFIRIYIRIYNDIRIIYIVKLTFLDRTQNITVSVSQFGYTCS